MAFSKEEAEEIKKQLLDQVDKLPNENKFQIKEYIKNLDNVGLEEFLKKNKIKISDTEENNEVSSEKPSECIFCQITKGKIPSYKLSENKKSVAILEINPLSKGHVIILPNEHVKIEKLPKSALSLSQKIAKKIKKKLKPEDIKIETSSFQGHAMINIIPLYKDAQLKKIQAEEKDLKDLQKKLKQTIRAKRKKEITQIKNSSEKPQNIEKEDLSKLPKIHFRIP